MFIAGKNIYRYGIFQPPTFGFRMVIHIKSHKNPMKSHASHEKPPSPSPAQLVPRGRRRDGSAFITMVDHHIPLLQRLDTAGLVK